MSRQVNLSDYLPQVIRDAAEFQAICTAENPELTQVFTCLENVMADQFVLDATVNGVSRWEKIIEIAPIADTLEERKAEILQRMNEQIPYTYRMFDNVLTVMLGADGYNLELQANDYILKIHLYTSSKAKKVSSLARRIVPANLMLNLSVEFTDNLNIYAGIVNGTIGKKRIGIPSPPNSNISMSAGIAHLRAGKKTIGLAVPANSKFCICAGNLTAKTGRITIGGIK